MTFASGSARFLTRPEARGSPTSVNTIGTVVVASFAAWVGFSPLVRITSTPAFRSAATAGLRALGVPLREPDVEDDVPPLGEPCIAESRP